MNTGLPSEMRWPLKGEDSGGSQRRSSTNTTSAEESRRSCADRIRWRLPPLRPVPPEARPVPPDWLRSRGRMVAYFGGVATAIVCDPLKLSLHPPEPALPKRPA